MNTEISRIDSYPLNEKGRDFIVGDIHGCFSYLGELLDQVHFNKEVDRLFSVGDLVDRGPESRAAIDFTGHAVRGNHEQMAIEAYYGMIKKYQYEYNGGEWFFEMSEAEQKRFVDFFLTLPYGIEIDTVLGKIGIIHAETDLSWNELKSAVKHDRYVRQTVIWGRSKIKAGDVTPVDGLVYLFVGHTPVKRPVALGNVLYIDTGAVFGEKMTMVEIGESGLVYHSIATPSKEYGNKNEFE